MRTLVVGLTLISASTGLGDPAPFVVACAFILGVLLGLVMSSTASQSKRRDDGQDNGSGTGYPVTMPYLVTNRTREGVQPTKVEDLPTPWRDAA